MAIAVYATLSATLPPPSKRFDYLSNLKNLAIAGIISMIGAAIFVNYRGGNNCQFSYKGLSDNRCIESLPKIITLALFHCLLDVHAGYFIISRYCAEEKQAQNLVLRDQIRNLENNSRNEVAAVVIANSEEESILYAEASLLQANENLSKEEYLLQCRQNLLESSPEAEASIQNSTVQIQTEIQKITETLDPSSQAKIQRILLQTISAIQTTVIKQVRKSILLDIENSFPSSKLPLLTWTSQLKTRIIPAIYQILPLLKEFTLLTREDRKENIELIKTNRKFLATLEEKAQEIHAQGCWTTDLWTLQDDKLEALFQYLSTLNEIIATESSMNKVTAEL